MSVIQRIEDGEFFGLTDEPTNEQYHSHHKYFGSSEIKTVQKGGVSALARKRASQESESSDSLILGSAVHALALEPEKEIVMIDPEEIKKPRRPSAAPDLKTLNDPEYQKKVEKYAKELAGYEAAQAEKDKKFAGKILLTPDEFELARFLADKLRNDSDVKKLIVNKGVSEASAYTQCPHTGLKIRARYDRLFLDLLSAIDLKTTSAKSEEAFIKDCVNYGYIHSNAHYLDVGSYVLGSPMKRIPIVAIQTVEPFDIWLIEFKREDIEFAREQNLFARAQIAQAVKTGNWGLNERKGFKEVTLPGFFYTQFQNTVQPVSAGGEAC
jgi:hypothetical protein